MSIYGTRSRVTGRDRGPSREFAWRDSGPEVRDFRGQWPDLCLIAFSGIFGSRDAGLGIGPAGLLSRDRVSGVLRVSKRVGVGVKILLRVGVRVRWYPRG